MEAIRALREHRLPNTLNVSFVGQVGAEILARIEGVAASTGWACHAGRIELSPVLEAMGVPPEVGMGAVRFSLGRATMAEDIEDVVDRVTRRTEWNSPQGRPDGDAEALVT